MQDEWYRDPAWDATAQLRFEERLARARAQSRPQYLRIKALALRGAGNPDAAAAMLHRLLELFGCEFEAPYANELLGDLAAEKGDDNLAEARYRRVLQLAPDLSTTSGSVEIALAEVLLRRREQGSRQEAHQLLDSFLARPGLKFDSQLFRWHLARIDLAEETGDEATARRAAATALELANRGPRLPRHKEVGLVHADKSTLLRLRRLAR
jgi:predicted Zn-dependent protease